MLIVGRVPLAVAEAELLHNATGIEKKAHAVALVLESLSIAEDAARKDLLNDEALGKTVDHAIEAIYWGGKVLLPRDEA